MLLAGLVSPLTQDNGKQGLQSEKQRAVEATALTFWGLLMLMTCVRVPVPMGSSRLPEGDCSVNWNDWKHRQTTSEARQGPTHYSQHRHTHTAHVQTSGDQISRAFPAQSIGFQASLRIRNERHGAKNDCKHRLLLKRTGPFPLTQKTQLMLKVCADLQ